MLWDREALLASPWFAAAHPVLARLPQDRFPSLDGLNALARERGVRTGGNAPLTFVPAAASGRGLDSQYEVRAFRTGEVPTRADSWHDLFNALAWLAFPRTKATLNRIHHDELVRRWGARQRGTARDVLTLFDEGGVVVACAAPALARCLGDFQWKELFWTRRPEAADAMRFFVFGHAILEKSLAPYKGVTAKALVIDVARASLALPAPSLVELLDERAAAHFARPGSLASTRLLHPLPVLGIPGWAPESEDPSYYDDENVFRPGRRRGRTLQS
ncbi:MAG: DUF3025 domain-containing protein [Burkholderiales bacterium]